MPMRGESRGTIYEYPEWMIMFISILAVKLKIKTYMGIHRMSTEYWDLIAAGEDIEPISGIAGVFHCRFTLHP